MEAILSGSEVSRKLKPPDAYRMIDFMFRRPKSAFLCVAVMAFAGCGPAPEARHEFSGEASREQIGRDSFRAEVLIPDRSAAAAADQIPTPDIITPFLGTAGDLGGERIAELLAALRELDPATAASAITGFLVTGMDRATGQEFALLGEGPVHVSLRALLLDELGRIDAVQAASVSRQLLDGSAALPADLQAIALRNIAAVAPDPLPPGEHAYLLAAWRKIAARPELLDGSCAASLSALGLASFLRDDTLLEPLFRLREETSSSQAAAAIEHAIERLVLGSPTAAVEYLAREQEALAAMPDLRGRLLAHADLGHPREAMAVQSFLANPDAPPEVIEAFVLSFASETETLRPALFEPGQALLLEDTIKDYAGALQMVRRWQQDPSMQGAAEALSIMELKLDALARDQLSVGD